MSLIKSINIAGVGFLCLALVLLIMAYANPNLKARPDKILLFLAMLCFLFGCSLI